MNTVVFHGKGAPEFLAKRLIDIGEPHGQESGEWMSEKSLYDKDHRYTVDASKLDQQAVVAMRTLFFQYVEHLHYSPREVCKIIQDAANEVMHETILSWPKPQAQGEKWWAIYVSI
jgi:hypothetical protein